MLEVAILSIIMLRIIMLSVIIWVSLCWVSHLYYCAARHYTECYFVKCQYTECLYGGSGIDIVSLSDILLLCSASLYWTLLYWVLWRHANCHKLLWQLLSKFSSIFLAHSLYDLVQHLRVRHEPAWVDHLTASLVYKKGLTYRSTNTLAYYSNLIALICFIIQ